MKADAIQRGLPALLAAVVLLSTIPAFFAIYREAAFNVAPRDDYAPALLALVGERGAPPTRQRTLLSSAPFGYRVLSVAAGIPFYGVLPYYPFSNLDAIDEPYLRATAALSMVSWLSMLLTVAVIYDIARRRFKCSSGASLLAALMSFGLFLFMGTAGVDPLAVLLIAILVYFRDRPVVFAPFIVLSVAVNEKIVIVFAILFAARALGWLVSRRPAFRDWPQVIATGAALVAYLSMRLLLRLPGNEGQTDPTTWLSGAASTVRASLSFKGLIQNGIPVAVMAILLVVVYAAWRQRGNVGGFSPLDFVVAPVLLVVGLIIDVQFTLGRLVMHSFPLYLPFAAFVIDELVIKNGVAPASSVSAGPE